MSANKNNLFPVFFKLEELHVLIIGAGEIGYEKLNTVLSNSPEANITVVANFIKKEVRELAFKHKHVQLVQASYHAELLDDADLIIAAVNDIDLAEQIRKDAKQKGRLLNAADKPALCDFYLGSVITKGDVKVAISTNGKSPTLARRLKEFFNGVLPEEIESLTNNLNTIRNNIQSGLKERIKKLNEITASLVEDNEQPT
ncbi:precorrin-2 dehydrogenase/sirohydrochlorin ferrochelatase family protein [Parafilimonas sp.]|uniref:precorrin-2 dehydrogenase/sirohydrochlorin ferrochelatase family protein n=1 Tax=Parafilimonas sp. TaxID=1969739 RepID=UPI0039E28BCE